MATTAKTAEKKVENKVEDTAEKLTAVANRAQDFFSALRTSARTSVEGIVEVDRLILNKIVEGTKETYDYGVKLASARDISTAVNMAGEFTKARLNKGVADTKEVLDLTNERAQKAMEPLFAKA